MRKDVNPPKQGEESRTRRLVNTLCVDCRDSGGMPPTNNTNNAPTLNLCVIEPSKDVFLFRFLGGLGVRRSIKRVSFYTTNPLFLRGLDLIFREGEL